MARNKDDLDRFIEYDIYIPTRTIYMGSRSHDPEGGESGTDFQMAERVIKNLHVLDQTPDKPINIIMNNLGGDLYHGMAIYDAIQACTNHVTIKVAGHAMSMGSIILQAADERYMYTNARIMIHYGSSGTSGHPTMAQNTLDDAKKYDKVMEQMFLEKIRQKHPKFKLTQLKKMLDHDTYLTAEESLNLGFIDGIV